LLERGLEELLEAAPGVRVGERAVHELGEPVDALLEQAFDELVLVRKPTVDGADADAGVTGDLVERHRLASLGEQLLGCVQDALAVALGVLSQSPLGPGHVPSRSSASPSSWWCWTPPS